jgi:hypothetical protein
MTYIDMPQEMHWPENGSRMISVGQVRCNRAGRCMQSPSVIR